MKTKTIIVAIKLFIIFSCSVETDTDLEKNISNPQLQGKSLNLSGGSGDESLGNANEGDELFESSSPPPADECTFPGVDYTTIDVPCEGFIKSYEDVKVAYNNLQPEVAALSKKIEGLDNIKSDMISKISAIETEIENLLAARTSFCPVDGTTDFNKRICVYPDGSKEVAPPSKMVQYTAQLALSAVPCGNAIYEFSTICSDPPEDPLGAGISFASKLIGGPKLKSVNSAYQCKQGEFRPAIKQAVKKFVLDGAKAIYSTAQVCEVEEKIWCLKWTPANAAFDVGWTLMNILIDSSSESYSCESPGVEHWSGYVQVNEIDSYFPTSIPPACGMNGSFEEMRKKLFDTKNNLESDMSAILSPFDMQELRDELNIKASELKDLKEDMDNAEALVQECQDKVTMSLMEYVEFVIPCCSGEPPTTTEPPSYPSFCHKSSLSCTTSGERCGPHQKSDGSITDCGGCPEYYHCDGISDLADKEGVFVEGSAFPPGASTGRCVLDIIDSECEADETGSTDCECRDYFACQNSAGQNPPFEALVPPTCVSLNCADLVTNTSWNPPFGNDEQIKSLRCKCEGICSTTTTVVTSTSTTYPESTSTSVPETTSTTLPEPTSTSVPETTSTTLPEPTSTSVPETTSTTLPEPTSTSVPETTSTTLPETTSTSVPATTSTTYPEPTSTTYPETTSTMIMESMGCTNPLATNYDALAATDDGSCVIYGCTDSDATNFNSEATHDDGLCEEETMGCTNPLAQNYDGLAATDDGSCVIYGCTDSDATNYNSEATHDDGLCEKETMGCTNPLAHNYDGLAATDDGSCVIYGCTDSDATNYNSEATHDDGFCETNWE